MSRDYGAELDAVKAGLTELQQLVRQWVHASPGKTSPHADVTETGMMVAAQLQERPGEAGGIFYSGQYRGEKWGYRWEPQERRVSELLGLDGDKVAKVLSALGHKQRLDILRSVLTEPLTGAELVERLNMGTTGQLYHHIKALLSANLLVQEERGGRYSLPGHRALPLLLLLSAASDLLDTSDYMELAEARSNAGAYLGGASEEYDPHLLLLAVVDNTILEHKAGYCTEANIFLHGDGSITVTDDGRGIPVQAHPGTDTPGVQAVLTRIVQRSDGASFFAPGGEKGISISVVNALSEKLTVGIRREGKSFRQDYKHGIPQTGLITVGTTKETGTSVTFLPDPDIFRASFSPARLSGLAEEISAAYPGLAVRFYDEAE
jgi:DNA gyrase subunit B